MDVNPERSDGEAQRPRWQGAAAVLALVLTALLIGSLLWFRFAGSQSHRPAGRILGSVTVSNVDFTCSLPITIYGNQAAMISFPDGQVTAEAPLPGSGPFGKGGPYTYDAVMQRWLPVQAAWLSPDGRTYAFATNTTGIPGQAPLSDVRVHDIATGKDRTVWQGDGQTNIVGWSGGTVVFQRMSFSVQTPHYGPDVWAVDAAGGNVHRVGPNPPPTPGLGGFYGGPNLIGGGALWGMTSSQPPPTAPPEPGKPFVKGPDLLTRMDLKDGTVTNWYQSPDPAALSLLGFTAQGQPVVALNQFFGFATPPPPGYQPPAPRLMLVTGRNQATQISAGGPDAPRLLGSSSADAHGVWFAAPGQLWLYRSGSLRKIADIPTSLFPPPTPPPGAVVGIASKAALAQSSALSGPFIQFAGACT
jgi:hypothetical protein